MYRLKLDVPYYFAIRSPFYCAQHGIDLRIEDKKNIFYDRESGLAFLMPSVFLFEWFNNAISANQFTFQSEHWTKSKRGNKSIGMLYQYIRERMDVLTRIKGSDPDTIGYNWSFALPPNAQPTLRWCIETVPVLVEDESFSVFFSTSSDEANYEEDFLYVQWDRFGIRLRPNGEIEFYVYDPTDFLKPPVMVDEWQTGVSQLMGESGHLTVVPAPPMGVMVILTSTGGSTGSASAMTSVSQNTVSSHLVPLKKYASQIPNTDRYRLCLDSKVRIATNTAVYFTIGFQRVRFANEGYFVDSPRGLPPIVPQTPTIEPIILFSRNQDAQCTIQYEDSSGNWQDWTTAQSPLRYRVKTTLQAQLYNGQNVYTPFVCGYYLQLPQSLQHYRRTNPVVLYNLKSVELTTDEYAEQEGFVEFYWEDGDPYTQLVMRGDTTYLLEYSFDGGQTWEVLSGGFAQVENIEFERVPRLPQKPPPRALALVRLRLNGFSSRFGEVHQLFEAAFDGMRLGDAFNKVLEGAGFAPIPDAELPSELQQYRLPVSRSGSTKGGWRYAPRVGQSGEEIIGTLRLLSVVTGKEWRLRYDFAAQKWRLEPKPSGLPALYLRPFGRHRLSGYYAYNQFSLNPQPPEGNLLLLFGATEAGKSGSQIQVQIVNERSLVDPSSRDYLGRIIPILLQTDAIADIEELEKMGQYIYKFGCRHYFKASLRVPLPDPLRTVDKRLFLDLPRRVAILKPSSDLNNPYFWGWVKEATLVSERGGNPKTYVKLEVDEIYESDPRK